MSASDSLELLMKQLFFQNANAANIGDATGLRGSTVAGVWYISLHTAAPLTSGNNGSQNTNEVAYGGYARLAIPRTSSDWTCDATNFRNTAAATFSMCTDFNSRIVTHLGIGATLTGGGVLWFYGALVTPITITNATVPQASVGNLKGTIN